MSNCSCNGGIYRIVGNYAVLGNNGACGSSSCNADPITSDGVIYGGANLPCTGINTCNSLTIALQKIDEKICDLVDLIYNMGITTTTTTTIS